MTVMAGLREVVERKGLFCALYSDRGSHFWLTPKAGGKVDTPRRTQVGRALRELGVQMIPAYSPQARGRSQQDQNSSKHPSNGREDGKDGGKAALEIAARFPPPGGCGIMWKKKTQNRTSHLLRKPDILICQEQPLSNLSGN